MGELVSKVAVCAQEGKKADGLDGEACEEDVYTLGYLSQGVSSRPFLWLVWKRTSVVVLAVAANPMPTD